MIHLSIEFPSLALLQPVNVEVALPTKVMKTSRYRTIWALHCAMERGSFFFEKLHFQDFVDECNIALIAPSLGNGCFVNSRWEAQADFLDELYVAMHEILPLSPEIRKNAVLGVSMGAYGAVRWALGSDFFGICGGFSGFYDCRLPDDPRLKKNRSQLIIDRVITPVVERILLDSGKNLAEQNDLASLVAKKDVSKGTPLYLYCGAQDYLSLWQTDYLVKICRERSYPAFVEYRDGEHDAKFWKSLIPDFIEQFNKLA